MSNTVYARVSEQAKTWLDAQSRITGLPIAKIIDALLIDAAQRNLQIEVRIPVVVMPQSKE